jgi:hypothetical protein
MACVSPDLRSQILRLARLAGKRAFRCRSIHGPLRSSVSPNRGVVSMWFTPCSNRRVKHAIGDAFIGHLEPALPKTTAELMWPVRRERTFAIAFRPRREAVES